MKYIVPQGFTGSIRFNPRQKTEKPTSPRTPREAVEQRSSVSPTPTPELTNESLLGGNEGVSDVVWEEGSWFEADVALSELPEEELRELAKREGIKNWWNKKPLNLIHELEDKLYES